jgi:hypothetical protein
MRQPGATAWDLVGNFSATEAEIAQLREVLEGEEPFEVLHKIKNVLISDTLDVIRAEGAQTRIVFHEDH